MVEYSLVLQSSRISKVPPKLVRHTRPTFFSTSETKKNRMPALCLHLSSSSSVTNLILSATFFLASTPHIIVDHSSPVIPRFPNASGIFSRSQDESLRTSLWMPSMSVPIPLGCSHLVKRSLTSWKISWNYVSRIYVFASRVGRRLTSEMSLNP
jgi:hypothetical protein